jgi:hypothetical protein
MSATTDLREFLERDVYPRLTPEQIYDHHSHNWRINNGKELRGGNPWRNSQSGESFVVNKQNLTWYLFGDKIGGDPVKYRWYLRSDLGAIEPRGKNFVEIVEELAVLAGVAMPTRYALALRSCLSEATLKESAQIATQTQQFNRRFGSPQERRSSQPKPLIPTVPEGEAVRLVRLQGTPPPSPQSQQDFDKRRGEVWKTTYIYSLTEDGQFNQWVVRTEWTDSSKAKGRDKVIYPWHRGADRRPVCKKGDEPWPAYRIEEALIAAKAVTDGFPIILGCEGETSVEVWRQLGLCAITLQGAAWDKDSLQRLADTLKARGVGLLYHPDRDEPGYKKAAKVQEACDRAGVFCLILNPLTLWESIPDAGDIVDVVEASGLNQIEIVRRVETALHTALQEQQRRISEQQSESVHGSFLASNNHSASSVDEELSKPNQWRAPESYNGEIGYWTYELIDKIESNPRTGEMKPVLNAKGYPVKKKVRKFHPLCDFDFTIEREFRLPTGGGGYVLLVRRSTDGYQGRVVVEASACKQTIDFEEAIEKGLGVDVSCNLKTSELKALFRELRLKYTYREGRTYLLADRCGQQADGTWVFKDCQFTKDGDPITEDESLIVWNPMMGDQETIPSPAIAPPDVEALPRMVAAMQKFFGENFMPALFTLGYGAAAMHFQRIMGKERFFPILNLYGDAGTGKTIAAECALSLFGLGWIETGSMSRVSVSALYEWGRLCGSMLLLFDDPTKQRDLDEIIKTWFNAKARKVRKNVQVPHSALMVTSNHALGEDLQATLTRLIRLWFPKTPCDKTALDKLMDAQNQASGAMTNLIKLGYPQAEVRALEKELIPHLSHAHVRLPLSLALVGVYAMKVAALAGVDPALVKQYIIEHLCPLCNDEESCQDSLAHFLGVLQHAQGESLVGSWNLKPVKDESGQLLSLAIEVGVFKMLDTRYQFPYSAKVIKTLIQQTGGKTRSLQRFHKSKDLSQAYERSLLAKPKTDAKGKPLLPEPPETVPRRCWEIPAQVVMDYIQLDELPTPPTDPGSSGGSNPPDGLVDSGNSNPSVTDPVTSVTTRNHSDSENGYSQNSDKTNVSASIQSCVTTVTTFFGEETSKQAEAATSVESFVDEMELENEGYDFEESVVTAETKTASKSELLPKNGYSEDEALQPYLEAMTSVETAEDLRSFEECLRDLTREQREAVWLNASPAVIERIWQIRLQENSAQLDSVVPPRYRSE